MSTQGSLDYADPAYWMCRPDMDPNECHRDLDATEVKTDGSLQIVKHERAKTPAFDCFYVYPTVWLNHGPTMTDFSETGVTLTLDALLAQAARFNRVCEVYAPFYRQSGLTGLAPDAAANMQQSQQDVRDAFHYYLEHYNKGRNFVLMGHSQGTFMLEALIRKEVDSDAALRAKLISALLIGGQPYVPPGQLVGGSFEHIEPCREPAQTGCVIAYNTFAADAPPTASSILGRVGPGFAPFPVDTSGQVICVDPRTVAGNSGRYAGSYFARTIYNPGFEAPPEFPAGITTPFVLYREFLRGECQTQNGASYLSVSLDQLPDDQRTLPSVRNQLTESIGFGLHLLDYNFMLDDLIEGVRQQAAAMP